MLSCFVTSPLRAQAFRLADLAPGQEPLSSKPVWLHEGPEAVLVGGSGVPLAILSRASGALRDVNCGGGCQLQSRGTSFVSADGWVAGVAAPLNGGDYDRTGFWAINLSSATARRLSPDAPSTLRSIVGTRMVVYTTGQFSEPRNSQLWSTTGTVASIRNLDAMLGGQVHTVYAIGSDTQRVWLQIDRPDGTKELGSTDGTPEGTAALGGVPGGIANIATLGEVTIFSVVPAGGGGPELWRASSTGLERIADAGQFDCPTPGFIYGLNVLPLPSDWAAIRCGEQGNPHYVVSDGTSGGTRRVLHSLVWDPSFPPVVGAGKLIAGGSDGVAGMEPRAINRDGSVELLADLCPGPCSSVVRPWYRAEVAWDIGLRPFLVVRPGVGVDLWVSDGVNPSASPRNLCNGCSEAAGAVAAKAGEVFWRFYEAAGMQHVAVHYSVAEHRVTRLREWQQQLETLPPLFAIGGGKLVFASTSAEAGNELWISDGSVAGTRMLRDRSPGLHGEGSGVRGLMRTTHGIVGLGYGGVDGWWRFDPEGPFLLRPSLAALWSVASDGAVAVWSEAGGAAATDGSRIWQLVATPGILGVEALGTGRFALWGASGLWVSDGSAAGTTRVATSNFGPYGRLGVLPDGSLLLSADNGEILWRTDGSLVGTDTLQVAPSFGKLLVAGDVVWLDDEQQMWARSLEGDTGPRVIWSTTTNWSFFVLGVANDRVILEFADPDRRHLAVGLDGQTFDLGPFPASNFRPLAWGRDRTFLHATSWHGSESETIVSTDGRTPWRVELEGPAAAYLKPSLVLPSGEVVLVGSGVWAFGGSVPRLLGALGVENAGFPGAVTVVDDVYLGLSATRGDGGSEPWLVPYRQLGERPFAPRGLKATRAGLFTLELSWEDRSDNEEGFLLEYRAADDERWSVLASFGPDTTRVVANAPWEAVAWRVVAANPAGRSVPSNLAGSWVLPPPWVPLPTGPGQCLADAETLCMSNGRYAVKTRWRTLDGQTGIGHPVGYDAAGTTGFFWFFDQANVELVVKMLDGEVINDHDWLFAGALSNVEYWISVLDTWSGATRSYYNPQNNICGFADVGAFWKNGAEAGTPQPGAVVPSLASTPQPRLLPPTGSRIPDPGSLSPSLADKSSSLTLLGGRYQVEVSWRTLDGATGAGVAVPATDQSGYFWFFDSANLELVVKILDGGPINGHAWLFHGALSNVEYDIAVTDLVTSERKVWHNPQGTICGGADVEAFPR